MVMQPRMRTTPYDQTQPYVRVERELEALHLTPEETAYLVRHVSLFAPREVLTALQVIKHDRTVRRATPAP